MGPWLQVTTEIEEEVEEEERETTQKLEKEGSTMALIEENETITREAKVLFAIFIVLRSKSIRRFRRDKNTLALPLFFLSVRRLFCCIILVPGLSLGELPNLFVLEFLRQTLISCIVSLL
jgi:hypothetical protein